MIKAVGQQLLCRPAADADDDDDDDDDGDDGDDVNYQISTP